MTARRGRLLRRRRAAHRRGADDPRDACGASSSARRMPLIEGCHAREEFPRQLIPRMAELGFFGANLKGYGCAGLSNVAYGLICQELERGDSGLRSMALGAGLARDVRHLALRHRGAEAALAAGDGGGPRDRLLRPDRARPRLRSRRHGDARAARRRRLGPHRHEALDHQRLDRRRRDRLGEGRRRRSAASWSRRARRASRRTTSRASSRCAPRSRRSWCSRTCACRRDAMLPGREGLGGPFSCLNQARYGIVWGALGAARTCYRRRSRYAQGRASSSTGRSPATSSCSRSSSTW